MHDIPVSVLRAVFNDPRNNELDGSTNFGDQVVAVKITQSGI
jgi:hypothetical protein